MTISYRPNGARALLSHTIDNAARIKWDRFRADTGNEEWVGDHPLIELHDELLDGLNYAAESRRQGRPVLDLETRLRELVRMVRLEVESLE